MKLLLGLIGLLGIAGAGWSQGNPALQCTFNAAKPTVRVEGITELVGDLLLNCVGGVPTPAGANVPQYNISVTLNTQETSRLLPNGSSDTLAIIDEPGTAAHPVPQKACPNLFGCVAVGNGKGIDYNGAAAPNIYVARDVSASTVEWDGIPIDPPGTTGVRLVRLTNVRANAAQLGATGGSQIVGTVSITGPTLVNIVNPQQALALIQSGLSFSVQGTNFVQTGNANLTAPGGGPAIINLKFTELFPGALKKRSDAASATNPFGDGTANMPGEVYKTESGFEPARDAGLPAGVGSADAGTILQASLKTANGCQASLPFQNPLSAQGSVAPVGTAVGIPFFGKVVGSNLVVPAQADGSIELAFMPSEVATTAGVKTLNVPVTLMCSLATPFTIGGSGGLAPAFYTQTTLFAPTSDLGAGIPAFASDVGIDPEATPADPFATVRDPALSPPAGIILFGGAPVFDGYAAGGVLGNQAASPEAAGSALLAPAQFDFGVVTLGAPFTNVTATKDPAATWLTVATNQSTTPVTATVKVDPMLAPGNYAANVTFSAPPAPSLVVPVKYSVKTIPFFTRWGFTNSGSYVNNVVAPGESFVIFGNNFGPATLAGPALGADGRVTTSTGSTQILFDGIPAPMYYSVGVNGVGQAAAFAPFSLDGKTQTKVQVVYNGVASPAVNIPVLDAVPALFTLDQSGGGQGAILNQNTSVNTAANPESPGNVVVLYGSGAGQTTPGGRDGALSGVGGPLGKFKLGVKVFIDGVAIAPADIAYAGPAPGLVEGVFQINVKIPANARHPANLPVVVQVEDKLTQPGVTIAVK